MTQITQPMFWGKNQCEEPGAIAQTGYQKGDNPAAEHENYFRRQTYLCIKQLQSFLFNTADEVTFLGEEGNLYYLDENGNRLVGEVYIKGIPYLFSPDGILRTGWQTVYGKRYYYRADTGNIVLGWFMYGGHQYYITLMDGKLVNQYRTIDGKDYHFDSDGVATEVVSE